MATNILTKNNARSTLLAGITAGQTNLSLQSGHGTRFSAPTGVQFAKLTLYDASGNIEICHGITRSGDSWSTILRGQEGTTARPWNAGDGISENATAGFLGGLSQLDREETFTAKKSFSSVAKFNAETEFVNGIGPGYINNVGLSASVASGALTIALKTRALIDPSPESPVEVSFRNRVAITGNFSVQSITTPKSITVPSGATLGYKPVLNTVTMTIASPCVITDSSHGRSANDTVIFTTTGALPTGLTAGTVYYIKDPTTDTYNVSATPGGAAINTSGSQSGTHTASYAEKGYIYVYLCYNATTLEIGVSKKAIFDESKGDHSATPITSGADSDNILYTTTAPDQFAVRLIGRIDITTGSVAGEWNNAPTRIALLQSNTKRDSQIIAQFSNSSSNSVTPVATPSSVDPVNVEIGDLVIVTLSTNCARNSADFALTIRYPFGGTAKLERGDSSYPNDFIFTVIGHAVYGAGSISSCSTVIRRVAKAGTFTGFSSSSAAVYGTTPINQSGQISVIVLRANL